VTQKRWPTPDAHQLSAILVAIVLLGLATAEERARLYVPLTLTAAACVASNARRRLPETAWTLLSLTALGLFAFQIALGGGEWLMAAVRLLLYLLVNRMHHLSTTRDHEQLLLVAFLGMLAIAVMATGLLVFPIFLAFAGAAFALLDALHRRREREATGQVIGSIRPVGVLRPAIAIWLVAVPLFFAFPRVGAGTFQARTLRPQHVSGFNDEVDLDDIGQIKENDSLVARVVPVSGATRGLRLLRVLAFRDFDGRRWRRDTTGVEMVRRDPDGAFDLAGGPERAQTARFELSVEPLSQAYLPLPDRTRRVHGTFRGLLVDRDHSVQVLDRRGSRRSRNTYEAEAWLGTPGPELLVDGVDPDEVRRHLHVPRLDPRIAALARSLAADDASRFDATRAILGHLQSFDYDLELTDADDPLAHFLFQSRSGHCELFASAMAILLRTRGVPARVVNGFRVSEWNGLGDYWIIRQADAHAWVEVYFPAAGWVEFDPTPPDPQRSRWALGLRGLSHLTDVLLYQWDRYVISWSGIDQRSVLDSLRDAAQAALVRPWRTALVALVALAILLAVGLARRRWSRAMTGPEVVRLYLRLRAELVRAGQELPVALGPGGLLERYRGVDAIRRPLEIYIEDRFAGRAADRARLASMRRDIRATRRALAASHTTTG